MVYCLLDIYKLTKNAKNRSQNASFAELLTALESGTFINEHYQSQLWRLTPNHLAQGPSVPMHFIGRLETFDESWNQLLKLIYKRSTLSSGLAVEQGAIDKIGRIMARKGKANSKKASAQMKNEILDDHELVKRIEELYAADYDCFGYERKHERPDVTPTVQRGEFNYKKSGWQVYPKAYKGPSLRPA